MWQAVPTPGPESPQWLLVAATVASLLVGVFGRGFIGSLFAWVRNQRQGLAARETEARQQEREYRATERTAAAEETERAFVRLGQEARDMSATITTLRGEVEELRDAVRVQFLREQSTMAGLTHHAGWDFMARQSLPLDFPEPPPLLPPQDQTHARDWGPSPA